MISVLKIPLLILLLNLTLISAAQVNNINKPSIEIYLLKDSFQIKKEQQRFNYFMPEQEELSDTAFIRDSEIIGYEMKDDTSYYKSGKLYAFILSNSALQKINNLKNIPLCCGLKFAITVDQHPIFGAYFWNVYSSVGCNWLVGFVNDGKLRLFKGAPVYYFHSAGHKDPRNNKHLIDALIISERLIDR